MERDYRELKARWLSGERDRELRLQLMFFAWMHWADPSFVTGLVDDPDATTLWKHLFGDGGGEMSADAEFLFVCGIMAYLFPHVLGDEEDWRQQGARMKDRALNLQPTAFSLNTFDNRGEYGKYFAHQLRGHIASSIGT